MNSLNLRLKESAEKNNMTLSLTEEFSDFNFGLDPVINKLIVCKPGEEYIIDLKGLQHCRKQKKWLHIPGKNGSRAETHLEKISLLFEFTGNKPVDELVFYEYRYNSIFQVYELEQKVDHWESLLNKKHHEQEK